jgi:hypothetical protein
MWLWSQVDVIIVTVGQTSWGVKMEARGWPVKVAAISSSRIQGKDAI